MREALPTRSIVSPFSSLPPTVARHGASGSVLGYLPYRCRAWSDFFSTDEACHPSLIDDAFAFQSDDDMRVPWFSPPPRHRIRRQGDIK
ncbi:hypothetical protein MIND_00118000 [Mycena indigotica]|uniref:Uncharacterized protein n=1 Tax=Mycena indigotica TaxID=2126181 RepID=A0A8H6WFQ5_9AGAR|nr:uncharacterized protein MIND_00118000 [Mycena indigotica]KAF7316007.1 hypothetical protein MIND_00118000 [Mycena indigotica]